MILVLFVKSKKKDVIIGFDAGYKIAFGVSKQYNIARKVVSNDI